MSFNIEKNWEVANLYHMWHNCHEQLVCGMQQIGEETEQKAKQQGTEQEGEQPKAGEGNQSDTREGVRLIYGTPTKKVSPCWSRRT